MAKTEKNDNPKTEKGVFDDATVNGTKFAEEEVNEGKALAAIAYIPFLCFISYLVGKDTNKFVYEHAKLGIILFICEVITLLGAIFWRVAFVLIAIVAVIGIIYAVLGKYWKIPLLGDLSQKLRL
ncbi:hypothetical protein JW877_07735 [bacterium]|nr:hypothetical protein [bacterium]